MIRTSWVGAIDFLTKISGESFHALTLAFFASTTAWKIMKKKRFEVFLWLLLSKKESKKPRPESRSSPFQIILGNIMTKNDALYVYGYFDEICFDYERFWQKLFQIRNKYFFHFLPSKNTSVYHGVSNETNPVTRYFSAKFTKKFSKKVTCRRIFWHFKNVQQMAPLKLWKINVSLWR